MRRGTRFFQNVFSASPIGIAVENLDGQLLFVNPAFCSMLGFTAEELRRKHCVDFSPAEDAKKDWLLFQQLRAGSINHYQLEKRYFRRDGSLMWGQLSISLLEDEPSPLVIAMVADITDKKLAEEALRESEEKFRHVFRDAGVGMVIVSLEGRFLQANTTFCECLGYTEDELREKTVESVTFAEDWPAFSAKLQQVLSDGSFLWFQKRCLHKSGRIVYTESSASLIRSSDGVPRYFVGQVLDITSRKQAEAALAGMTRKLIDAQEKERARIARELHDDINQRLAMMSIELQELQQDPANANERIHELQDRVDQLSIDVQAVSRDLHPSKLEYLGVVAGIRGWCKEFGDHHKMTIHFKSDVSRPLPAGLGLTLLRITQEALNNAMKYSGVRSAEVCLHDDSDEICLVISDAGVGFSMKEATESMGLGLTSMRERVRLLNGRISIDSKPMHGTQVSVHLPLESSRHYQPIAV